ncbi:hypothetical protein FM037_13640 [Shewanella psychropiezotolerans]|uniref:Carrier domain-containing protein n=1 Tax=Shewanella psychropiezotolerans TaxID=2593655 RepID=A0ABX5WY98_9GAMM|nr:phosphopantetheine-binding protein [Shewanella psychropiezotolerans]QDO84083.1 hypothetical protein FM037_13640 [Shewanella psychropiezotolerans]
MFRNALKETLPEYMVPATFTQMTELPLSINGKLDRHALPEPKFVAVDNYVAPRDEHEKDICVIWQDVLGLQRVGINDDFFKIGGESISAIRLSHRVTAELGYQVSVANIFSYPTILSLLENIDFNKQSTTYGEL